jgi:hypothetical protein
MPVPPVPAPPLELLEPALEPPVPAPPVEPPLPAVPVPELPDVAPALPAAPFFEPPSSSLPQATTSAAMLHNASEVRKTEPEKDGAFMQGDDPTFAVLKKTRGATAEITPRAREQQK